uniref:ARID domain-containing protein n=1 Tax=Lotharella globosa TaxID=91324 RepID=A0A7S3ZFX8_9EUKA
MSFSDLCRSQGHSAKLCNGCALHLDRSQCCVYCQQIYRQRDSDLFDGKRWVECVDCLRWSHVDCEVAAGYKSAAESYAAMKSGKEYHYRCRGCRGDSVKMTLEQKSKVVPTKTKGSKRKSSNLKQETHDFSSIFLKAAEEAEKQQRSNAQLITPSAAGPLTSVVSKLTYPTSLGGHKTRAESVCPKLSFVRPESKSKMPPQLSNLSRSEAGPLKKKQKRAHSKEALAKLSVVELFDLYQKQKGKLPDFKNADGVAKEALLAIRKSNVLRMQQKRRARLGAVEFYKKLTTFLNSISAPITRYPTFGGQDVNLYNLYRQVVARGGYDRIAKDEKSWREILARLGSFPKTQKAIENNCCLLRGFYQEYLYAYEQHTHFSKSVEEVRKKPFPTAGKQYKHQHPQGKTPRMKNNLMQQGCAVANLGF